MTSIFSGVFIGLESLTIEIEIDIRSKLKNFEIVGLPNTAIKESIKRIEAAILNSGFHFPGKQITVNLAPAGVRKIGTLFDLPIALGILSSETDTVIPSDTFIVGELSLDGRLRASKGILLLASHAEKQGFKTFICSKENAREAMLVKNLNIIGVENLKEIFNILQGTEKYIPISSHPYINEQHTENIGCFSDVKGQESAKRALEIAAAGGHNILMLGPPGTGKTMLARRIPSILPSMSYQEAIETSKIHSVAGLLGDNPLITHRPFRSPHHTASDISIVGGGRFPKPGEISLAHNGVLFIDEMQEFQSSVIQVLRQPLEEKKITISRAEGVVEFPAGFMLVGAMNPSRHSREHIDSSWESDDIQRLIKKFSHPFLDRIDMHIQVAPVPYEKIELSTKGEKSQTIRERIIQARQIQQERFATENILINADMPPQLVEKYCQPSPGAKDILKLAMERLNLSLRSYDKILKCSRTIADLAGDHQINETHVSESLQYRILDRILGASQK
ncbi:MAG: YifB family Mg chelatase-like AAA ATPase [Brevinemataceae bacterium]